MLKFLNARRLPFVMLALVCFSLLGGALYLQAKEGITPCPMCVMQRVAFIITGLWALLAAIHGSRGMGRAVYGVLILITALVGAGVAANQSWLQLHPPLIASCGADFSYMMDNFSVTDWLPMVFKGEGDCSAVDWRFLGLSVANWSLICFLLIAIAALIALAAMRRRPSKWSREFD